MHECSFCKETKPKDSFYLNKKGYLVSPQCKRCYNKLQYERKKNTGYYANMKPETIEKMKESRKAYMKSERGREISRKACIEYRKTEKYKESCQRRNEQKRINPHIKELNKQLRAAKSNYRKRVIEQEKYNHYSKIAGKYSNNKMNIVKEEYKEIEGFEHYSISNYGNVYSYISGKLLNLILCSTHGYYKVNLYSNNKRKTFKVHRLVAEAFISNPFNKEEINHIDSNRINNYVGNLEWTTRQENQAHRACANRGLIDV